jgi:hypothetical protein
VLPLHFALGNDVAIDLTDDFFDDPYVRGASHAEGEKRGEEKTEVHIRPSILASAGRHPRPASKLQPKS